MKNITIKKDVWKRIRKIKGENNIKNFSKTIEFLIDYFEHQSLHGEKNSESEQLDAKPLSKDRLEEEIERNVDEILAKRKNRCI